MYLIRRSFSKSRANTCAIALALMVWTQCGLEIPSASGQARPSAAAHFQAGQEALARGALGDAEAAFKEVLRIDPQSAAAHANLGVIAMRRKEWDRAIVELRKAERLDPKMAGVRLNIGLVEFRRANYLAAIGPLQSVVKAQPESVQARYLLGLCFSFVEKYQDAVNALEPLWPQMSSQFPYLYVLGNSAYHAGNQALDQKALQKLIEVGGDAPEFHLLLAKALLNKNDDQRAFEELQKAAAGNPNLAFLHFNLGIVYQRSGQAELAEQEFHKDISVEPDLPYSYERLGKLYLQAGKEQEAEKYFQDALKRESRLPIALLELAKINYRRGDWNAALEQSSAAVKLVPDNKNVHVVHAQILQKLGRAEEARREFALARKNLAAGVESDRAAMEKDHIPDPELAQQP